MVTAELVDEVDTSDILGEGIVWDARTGSFLWSDILGKRLHRLHLKSGHLETHVTPHRLASMALTPDIDLIIAAFDIGLATFRLSSGATNWLHKPDLPPGVRFNDGRCDAFGRFWVGTMVEDAEAAGATDLGELYCLNTSGQLHSILGEIHISNGLCWSPDAKHMFHSDSPKGDVSVYTQFETIGQAPIRTVLVNTLDDGGAPDGAICDAEGTYWSALWGGGKVAGFGPDGMKVAEVTIPAPHATCPCLGGPDLNIMAVTSARAELSKAQLSASQRSGNMFLYETNLRGQPTCIYEGPTPN